MDRTTQRSLAETFRDGHTVGGTKPLLLPNSWDAASTIIYEEAGFEAVGTSSAGIAASLGVPDGEVLGRDDMLAVVERIANSVDIPVSADMEAGYGDSPPEVAETVRLTIEAGAVGINLEDGTNDPAQPLIETDQHAARIRAAREAADEAGIPLVINGRTDVFWREVGDKSDQVVATIERANAYAAAGSDCLFVPGVTDLSAISELVAGIDGPVNILGGPGAPPIADLENAGVARVSIGSGPMRATLGFLREISAELLTTGTYDRMANAIPYAELIDLLEEPKPG